MSLFNLHRLSEESTLDHIQSWSALELQAARRTVTPEPDLNITGRHPSGLLRNLFRTVPCPKPCHAELPTRPDNSSLPPGPAPPVGPVFPVGVRQVALHSGSHILCHFRVGQSGNTGLRTGFSGSYPPISQESSAPCRRSSTHGVAWSTLIE